MDERTPVQGHQQGAAGAAPFATNAPGDDLAALQRRRLSSALTGLPAHLLAGSGLRHQAQATTLQHLGRARRAAQAYRPHLRAAATAAITAAENAFGISPSAGSGSPGNSVLSPEDAAGVRIRPGAVGKHSSSSSHPQAPHLSSHLDSAANGGASTALPSAEAGSLASPAASAEARWWRGLCHVAQKLQSGIPAFEAQKSAATLEGLRGWEELQRRKRELQELSLQRRGGAGRLLAARRAAALELQQRLNMGQLERDAALARSREELAGLLSQLFDLATDGDSEQQVARRLLHGSGGGGGAAADGGGGGGGGREQSGGEHGTGGGGGVAARRVVSMLPAMHLQEAAAEPGSPAAPGGCCDPDAAGLPGRAAFLVRCLVDAWEGVPGRMKLNFGMRDALMRQAAELTDALVRLHGGPVLTYAELRSLVFLLRELHVQTRGPGSGSSDTSGGGGGGAAPLGPFAGASGPFDNDWRLAALTSAPALCRVARRAAATVPQVAPSVAADSAAATSGGTQHRGSGSDSSSGSGSRAAANHAKEPPLPTSVLSELMGVLAMAISGGLRRMGQSDTRVGHAAGDDHHDPWVTIAAVLRSEAAECAAAYRRMRVAGASGAGAGRPEEDFDWEWSGWSEERFRLSVVKALSWLPHELVAGAKDAAAAATIGAAAAGRAAAPAVGNGGGEAVGSGEAETRGREEEGEAADARPMVVQELGRLAARIEVARALLDADGGQRMEVEVAVEGGRGGVVLPLLGLAALVDTCRHRTQGLIDALTDLDFLSGQIRRHGSAGGGGGGASASASGGEDGSSSGSSDEAGGVGGGGGGAGGGGKRRRAARVAGRSRADSEGHEVLGHVFLQPELSSEAEGTSSASPAAGGGSGGGAAGGFGVVPVRLALSCGSGRRLRARVLGITSETATTVIAVGLRHLRSPAGRELIGFAVSEKLREKRLAAIRFEDEGEDGAAAAETFLLLLAQLRAELRSSGRDLLVVPVLGSIAGLGTALRHLLTLLGDAVSLDTRHGPSPACPSGGPEHDGQGEAGSGSRPRYVLDPQWRRRYRLVLSRGLSGWLELLGREPPEPDADPEELVMAEARAAAEAPPMPGLGALLRSLVLLVLETDPRVAEAVLPPPPEAEAEAARCPSPDFWL